MADGASCLQLLLSGPPPLSFYVRCMRKLLLIAVLAALSACGPSTRQELDRISHSSDPATLSLERGYNDYVRRAKLTDGTEVGIIQCRDGSSSRYWFRSHHITKDLGGTLFRLSDGSELYMSGAFCCEVQLPDRPLASLEELRGFVRQHDGIKP